MAGSSARGVIEEDLGRISERHPHKRIYSEQELAYVRQIASVGGQFREEDWIVYELGQHDVLHPIPTFEG